MLSLEIRNKCKKSIARQKKRGKDLSKFQHVVGMLLKQEPLHAKYRNHKLTGNYNGFWECHIEPDWLLVYYIEGKVLYLADTGTHADLF